MALLTDIDKDSYTRTGKTGLSGWSRFISYVPILRDLGGEGGLLSRIPIIGGSLTAVLGYGGTIWESAQFLFRGQIGSAATALAAGTAETMVNALPGVSWWAGNALSGVATGVTLGTHARALTETVIGGATGALGMRPQVLSSYTAGIGSNGGAAAPSGPGRFASSISAERGQNADAAYQRYMSGEGGVHVNELQSANYRGA